MRQNNKNNRGRGRGGRKSPNPLTRSYESNGPDVKVRGTAQHVAEKYMSLARDALSSGDSVAAENYLQHAEHYNRIIMTAQAQQNSAREEERRQHAAANGQEEQPSTSQNPSPVVTGDEPQPTIDDGARKAADAKSNGASPAHEENGSSFEDQPKPRRRRSPNKPRPPKSDDMGASEVTPTAKDSGESIADNPPAFLVSE